jgi:hypothetical protein
MERAQNIQINFSSRLTRTRGHLQSQIAESQRLHGADESRRKRTGVYCYLGQLIRARMLRSAARPNLRHITVAFRCGGTASLLGMYFLSRRNHSDGAVTPKPRSYANSCCWTIAEAASVGEVLEPSLSKRVPYASAHVRRSLPSDSRMCAGAPSLWRDWMGLQLSGSSVQGGVVEPSSFLFLPSHGSSRCLSRHDLGRIGAMHPSLRHVLPSGLGRRVSRKFR